MHKQQFRIFIDEKKKFLLGDPPIHQTISVTPNRDLLNIYASLPHSPLQIPHYLDPPLGQHDPISVDGFQRGWHCDTCTLPVADLIVIICAPSEQVPAASTRPCTRMGLKCE